MCKNSDSATTEKRPATNQCCILQVEALIFSLEVLCMSITRKNFLYLATAGSVSSLMAAPVAAQSAATRVDWKLLRGLNYRTGELSADLKAVNGKLVKAPGFMVPLEDEEEIVNEFLLVPYMGACVHTPPPPPNQIVYVTMENKKRIKLSFWDPVWIFGKLDATPTDSPYGSVGFRLTGTKVEPYKE
jgi:uncharacterized protein